MRRCADELEATHATVVAQYDAQLTDVLTQLLSAGKRLRDEEFQCREAACRGVQEARELWEIKAHTGKLREEVYAYDLERNQLRTRLKQESADHAADGRAGKLLSFFQDRDLHFGFYFSHFSK